MFAAANIEYCQHLIHGSAPESASRKRILHSIKTRLL